MSDANSKVDSTPDLTTDLSPVRSDEEMEWPSLESWLTKEIPELNGPMRVAQFHGGHANLTYCVSFGETSLVVRRPPHGTIAPGAHDMARENRVLSGLAPSFDRAPRAFAYCEDATVIGAPFIVMERRRGIVVRGEIPEPLAGHENVERRISFALVDAMSELHSIPPDSVGLSRLGRPEAFVERQLDGWKNRWELCRAEPLAIFDELHARLVATRPATMRHCIVHNDLKLDNCMFEPSDPDRVTTIFDWDMATLGDPLVELGTLLSYWQEPNDSFERAATIDLDMSRFPARSELIARYAQAGFDVDQIEWYEAFALWKLAVVLQQLYGRFERGETEDPRFEKFGAHVPRILLGAYEDVLT